MILSAIERGPNSSSGLGPLTYYLVGLDGFQLIPTTKNRVDSLGGCYGKVQVHVTQEQVLGEQLRSVGSLVSGEALRKQKNDKTFFISGVVAVLGVTVGDALQSSKSVNAGGGGECDHGYLP